MSDFVIVGSDDSDSLYIDDSEYTAVPVGIVKTEMELLIERVEALEKRLAELEAIITALPQDIASGIQRAVGDE